MKIGIPILLTMLVLSARLPLAQAPSAFERNDTEGYFARFDPEATFVFHTTPHRLENRAAYRQEWATWEKDLGFRVRSCSSSDQRVQLFGDVAVLPTRYAPRSRL